MGGDTLTDEDWDFTSTSNGARNLVLVGRTGNGNGNGKSATANSILGSKTFKSRSSLTGVTRTCELKQAELKDGGIINVIDTPGMPGVDFVVREISKCISFTKDGIHAILVIISINGRFSPEEKDALECLQAICGKKIVDYMIVLFTGGDILEDNGEILEENLCECPESLKEMLTLCDNRRVLFDNKTEDVQKRGRQLQQLLGLVDNVIAQNEGQPYTDELFVALKRGNEKEGVLYNKQDAAADEYSLRDTSSCSKAEILEQISSSCENQFHRMTDVVESKLREIGLQKQMEEDKAALKKAADEIRALKENLESARMETGELRKQIENKCTIL